MTLDDTQKAQVRQWIGDGLKLAEIQKKVEEDLGVKLTYMELRFLVDDLKVMPKDPPPAPTPTLGAPGGASAPGVPPPGSPAPAMPGIPGSVSVTVDNVTRPGALVSGSVRFGDGNTAIWYLDQTGKLGVAPQQPGYKPTQADLQAFQTELQGQLQKLGF